MTSVTKIIHHQVFVIWYPSLSRVIIYSICNPLTTGPDYIRSFSFIFIGTLNTSYYSI